MSAALVVTTDGRQACIERSVPSALANLQGLPLEAVLICDDSGDPDYRAWLQARFPAAQIIGEGPRIGFAPAVRRAWAAAVASGCEHVFWLEDDFVIQRPVDLARMAAVLAEEPQLVQLLLKRQPWFGNEVAAGGIIEAAPDDFEDCSNDRGDRWVRYRAFWTNPFLVERAFLAAHRWPNAERSEAIFSIEIREAGLFGAFWGGRSDPPLVDHVGIRQGWGY